MTIRRLAPLASALALAGTVLPAAQAARPNPTCPGCRPAAASAAHRAVVVRPTAHSVDVLSLRPVWLAR